VICNGDRIVVTAQWSSFYRMRGIVVAVTPHLMVLIDDDAYPIRMGEREVTRESVEPTWTAGE
jgi:hypothetical protein